MNQRLSLIQIDSQLNDVKIILKSVVHERLEFGKQELSKHIEMIAPKTEVESLSSMSLKDFSRSIKVYFLDFQTKILSIGKQKIISNYYEMIPTSWYEIYKSFQNAFANIAFYVNQTDELLKKSKVLLQEVQNRLLTFDQMIEGIPKKVCEYKKLVMNTVTLVDYNASTPPVDGDKAVVVVAADNDGNYDITEKKRILDDFVKDVIPDGIELFDKLLQDLNQLISAFSKNISAVASFKIKFSPNVTINKTIFSQGKLIFRE